MSDIRRVTIIKKFLLGELFEKAIIYSKEVKLMNEIFMALLAGLIVGFIFAILRLPIPAPPVLSGIMGIIGIFLGYKAFEMLMPLITK